MQASGRSLRTLALCLLGFVLLTWLGGQGLQALAGRAGSPAFNPYLVAIPGSGHNADALIVSAGGIGEQPRPVYVNADQGPTSHKHSYAMAFDSAEQVYRYTLENFFTTSGSVAGTVEITTTDALSQTVSGGLRRYERWPFYHDEAAQLSTQNGFFTLSLDAASFDAALTYLLVIETATPTVDPPGHTGMHVAYSLWASGAVNQTQRPYLLILSYRDEWLAGADPGDLAIFWYDPGQKSWVQQPSTVHADRRQVVLATTRLGTFRLFLARPVLYLPLVAR